MCGWEGKGEGECVFMNEKVALLRLRVIVEKYC